MTPANEFNFLSALLPLAGVIFIIAVGVILLNQHFHKNMYRQRLEREALKMVHQEELLRSSFAIQEEERKRIAADLHDELGATLSITRMHLLQLERQLATAENPVAQLQNIRNLTETALASMRRISHQLMPPQLEDFGLTKTLQAIANQVNQGGKLQLTLNIQSNLPRFAWQVEVGLYRIVMEMINNTLKHAEASAISIALNYHDKHLICEYTDNGKGITTESSEGLGLKSMEVRASSLGGTLTLNNTGATGFSACIKIPTDS